jgi:alpha-beta hydrolase superfamily lysophospholipase
MVSSAQVTQGTRSRRLDGAKPGATVEQVTDLGRRARIRKELHLAPLPGGGALALVRKRPAEGVTRAPLLLLHGYAQNRYAWHLPGRSPSAWLAASGYDVWNLELRGVGRSREHGAPPATSILQYVERDVPAALAVVTREGGGAPFLMGHSMGAAIACAAAGREPGAVRGVVALSGLYRFASGSPWLRALSAGLRGVGHLVPRGLHGRAHLPTGLVGRALAATRRAWESPASRLLPVRAWARGAVEPEVLRSSLVQSFEHAPLAVTLEIARLARGEEPMDSGGRRLFAPFEERRDLPLLVMAGARDGLIDARDAQAAYERSPSRDRTWVHFDGRHGSSAGFGHIDIVMGREAPRVVWPRIRAWLDAR